MNRSTSTGESPGASVSTLHLHVGHIGIGVDGNGLKANTPAAAQKQARPMMRIAGAGKIPAARQSLSGLDFGYRVQT